MLIPTFKVPSDVALPHAFPNPSSLHSQPLLQLPSTLTQPEAQPFVGIPQTLLVQVGPTTLGAAQSLLAVAAQQLPDAVDTQVPGAPAAPGHSFVAAGHEQLPAGPLHVSPLTLRIREQSALVQQRLLLMQLLLPAHW